MALTVTLFIIGLFVFGVGVWALSKSEGNFLGLPIGACGLTFIVFTTFVLAPGLIPSGLPATSLDGGEYKVAFVYVAGENVNVGIEGIEIKKEKDGNERLYLFQFPKSAFDGSMNPQAKKLVVVESGGFRKLVLK